MTQKSVTHRRGPREGGPPKSGAPRGTAHKGPAAPPPLWEAEVIFGLEEFAEDELRERLGQSVRLLGRTAPGRVAFAYVGADRLLDTLRSVVAVHRVETFDVPRPKALLGHEHLMRLVVMIHNILARQAPGAFRTFRLSAAGSDSAVLQRLKGEIARHTGLAPQEPGADLLLALRPTPRGTGWQVLARRTPRPLSARAWRVCSMPGALDASIAVVMAGLARPRPAERFLNLACGSGTLLAERLGLGPAALALGVDIDPQALDCARANLQAAGHLADVQLVLGDATELPLAAASVHTIMTDLPWGFLVGSRRENERLYPALLREATRVAAPGAALVAITASHAAFEDTLGRERGSWRTDRVVEVQVPWERGYLRPRIYLLRRTGG